MAVTNGKVEIVISLKGDNQTGAATKAATKDLKRLEQQAMDTTTALGRSAAKTKQNFLGFKTAAGAALGKLGLVSAGVRTLVSGFKELGETVKEGAALSDQMAILEKDVANLGDTIGKVKKASEGMISTKEIVKSAAMFKSFGIPLDQIDDAMAEVAKTSLRTGQSVEFLTESLTLGLARNSPKILDNLGLTIKLSEGTQRATETTGKLTSALSAQETTAGLMAVTMDKLKKSNINVDLTDSQTAAIQRLSVGYTEATDKLKMFASAATTEVLELVGVMAPALTEWQRALEAVTGETGKAAGPVERLVDGYTDYLQLAAGPLVNGIIAIGEAIFSTTTAEDQAQAAIVRSTKALFSQEEAARRSAIAIDTLSTALGRVGDKVEKARVEKAAANAVNAIVKRTLARQAKLLELMRRQQTGVAELMVSEERYAQILLESFMLQEGLADEAERAAKAASEKESSVIATENAQDAATAAIVTGLQEQLALEEELIARANGKQDIDFQIEAVKKKINGLDRESIGSLSELVSLTRQLLGLEDQRRIEKSADAAAKPTRRRGGGGRRRRAEGLTVEKLIQSDLLRLKLQRDISDETKREIIAKDGLLSRSNIMNRIASKQLSVAEGMRQIEDRRLETAFALEQVEIDREARLKREEEIVKRQLEQMNAAALSARQGFGLEGDEFAQRRSDVGRAADAGQITGEEQRKLVAGIDVEEDQARLAEAYDAVADAASAAAAAQDESVAAFGRLAVAIGDNGDEIISVVSDMAAAMQQGGKNWAGAAESAIMVSGKLASSAVDDQKTQAAIMGAVELAAGIAAFAYSDYTGGALHLVSSGLYFAVAGTSSSGGASSGASTASTTSGRPSMQAKPPPPGSQTGTTVVNINAPVIGAGGVQEVATQLNALSSANSGTGFDEENAA